MLPSPTAAATRLTGLKRTSPQAKMPAIEQGEDRARVALVRRVLARGEADVRRHAREPLPLGLSERRENRDFADLLAAYHRGFTVLSAIDRQRIRHKWRLSYGLTMIERIEAMPAGTIGLTASGKLSVDDYRDVLEPALAEGIESGELRLLFVLTTFDGLEHGAWVEDVKTGLKTWVRDHSAWKRFALVTNVEWVAKAMRMFTWMTPGEVLVRDLDGLDEAKAWVAG